MKKTEKVTRACKSLFIGLVLSVFVVGCKKDVVATGNEDSSFQTPSADDLGISAITTIPSGSYDLTRSLPSGYKKDGTVDYTTYVQAAITANSNVTFPAFPIMVSAKGVNIPSNRTLNFLTGSKIVLKPTALGNYNIFRVENASNIIFNNPVIVGDVGSHLGTSGEWGNGITILSSNNITINEGSITKCWGDGIYLSSSKTKATNTNIKITNTVLQYNRRDGISIITANGLVMESVVAGNSTGTLPMCGINFEPNSSSDELQNIDLLNCKTEYNGKNGIQIGYSNLFGGPNKRTSINIQNHYDKKSAGAVRAICDYTKKRGTETMSGTLTITAPYWRQNSVTTIATYFYEPDLKLILSKPSITAVDGTVLTQEQMVSNLTYKTRINRGANYSLTF
jgi:hypothetical protein